MARVAAAVTCPYGASQRSRLRLAICQVGQMGHRVDTCVLITFMPSRSGLPNGCGTELHSIQ
eukprot:scaffold481754_cov22-Prasinocladus_malaysianus.AAC.1